MEHNFYRYAQNDYKTETEAINQWIKDYEENNGISYFTVYRMRDGKYLSGLKLQIIDLDQLQKIRNVMNDCMVYYKNSHHVYNYRNMKKIKFESLNYIVFGNLRGVNGNVEGGCRIVYTNNKLVKIS